MRVALDATPLTLSSGGLPRYVSELSLALAREFPEDIYSLLSDQPFNMPDPAPANLVRGRKPGSLAERRWWLLGIQRAMKQMGVEVFHGTNFEVPYRGTTPAILTIHDLSPWRDKSWHDEADRVRLRTPWLLRLKRARLIVTVSEAVRQEVVAHFGIDAAQVRAIPLAASNRFHPMLPGSAPQQPFFLFVGTLEPRKNVEGIVQAWLESREVTGADLIVAGRNRSDFKDIAPCPGLHLLGEVPEQELPQLYSDALAFVYPTHYEGFGLPVLEAMQCGCPVITSHDPAVKEVSSGAAIHAASTHEIADAMKALAGDTTLRASMHEAGIKRAADFSWSRTAIETRALYAEALGANRS